MVAYYNFRILAATPTEILPQKRLNRQGTKERGPSRKYKDLPISAAMLAQIRKSIIRIQTFAGPGVEKGRLDERKELWKELARLHGLIAESSDPVDVEFASVIFKCVLQDSSDFDSKNLGTWRTYFYAMGSMIRAKYEGRALKKVLDYMPAAMGILLKYTNLPDWLTIQVKKGRKRAPARQLPLLSPVECAAMLAVAPHNPVPSHFRELTCYLLRCILAYSGRRAACLVELQVGHLKSFNGEREILIPSTKGKIRNSHLVLNPLWPQHALDAFDLFLKVCREMGIPARRQMSDLAGLGSFTRKEVQQFHSALSQRLKSLTKKTHANSVAYGSTHIGRVGWYSWLPIRVLCAHYPKLLNHPVLKGIAQQMFFTPLELARLKTLFPDRCVDLLFIMKRLASHASDAIPSERYIRSWPLLARLYHDLEYGWPENASN